MINVYDFDGTIYDGDSTIDFVKYCFKKKKKTLIVLPRFIVSCFLYILKVHDKDTLKSNLFRIIIFIDDLDKFVDDFWNTHEKNIKSFYRKQKTKNDLIVSASPTFLLNNISKRERFRLIATEVDLKTGKIIGKNCHGEEKVKRIKKEGIKSINNFYSDSESDLPLAKMAKKAFLVKKNKVYKWRVSC
jgi:HAD superfamily phosphoserine phosphatase-like hydrolase